MSASGDAVGSDTTSVSSARRLPVLLTVTVLALVYQQIPSPVGIAIAKTWLHHALPFLASGLAAQFLRQGAKATVTHTRSALKRLKDLKQGFVFGFDPRRIGSGGDRDTG